MDCHHTGASAQQVVEQAFARKINGVATQCTKHKALAAIPKDSGRVEIKFIVSKCNSVANKCFFLVNATELH